MQWRKLAILIVLVLIVLGVSLTWSAWRRANTHPASPGFVPGIPASQAPR